MGRPELTLIKGGGNNPPDDPPDDSFDAPPDYREFLPQGDTLFGTLDEENEAAFRAQFPELIPALDQLKQTIREWQEKFKNLPSAAAKEQAELLDWRLLIKSTTNQEAHGPGENFFMVTVQCVDSPASGFELLQKVYDWTQQIPAMLPKIQNEKEEAEGRYQKAADDINEQLMQWTWDNSSCKPSLELAKLEESVPILRQLPWKHKGFLRGGVNRFNQNIDALEREGRRFQEASKKEENLNRIQKILANQLPSASNLQVWAQMFKEYLDQPPPTPINPKILPPSSLHTQFSFTHDPVLAAQQKAREAQQAQEAEKERAQREAERLAAEEARRARTIAAVRAKTRRRFRNGFALILAVGIFSVIYARWEAARTRRIEEKTQTTDREIRALEEETEQLWASAADDEEEIERLIGQIAAEAVEEGLKNQEAIGRFVESGDGTLLYQAIIAAFSERLMGNEWIRMTEMRIDMILEEEGVGPPYLYTLEIKYSILDKNRGITNEHALLRPHVPFDRVPPANPAHLHGRLPVKVGPSAHELDR